MIKPVFILFLNLAVASFARDTKVMMPLGKILSSKVFKEKVGTGIKFEFADTTIPPEAKNLGSVKSSRKTSVFGKSDSAGCEWVFLSNMIALKQEAISKGADEVVGIVSNYKNIEYSSPTEYECHAGGIMAGVALKGTLVKLKK